METGLNHSSFRRRESLLRTTNLWLNDTLYLTQEFNIQQWAELALIPTTESDVVNRVKLNIIIMLKFTKKDLTVHFRSLHR